jgi:hypothetical protein
MVQIWFEADDDDLSDFNWEHWLPVWFEIKGVNTRAFPWKDVQHEISWWITRRLSPGEWDALDNAESEVLTRIVGADHFQGVAGPIPPYRDEGER